MMSHRVRRTLPLLLLGGVMACTGPDLESVDLAGSWRAVLRSPGGELPFEIIIAAEGAEIPAVVRNGVEEAPFTLLERDGDQVRLRIDGYDSEIVAWLQPGGDRMEGTWTKTALEGESTLPFEADRGLAYRFSPPAGNTAGRPGAPDSIAGAWAVTFTDEDGEQPARAELRQEANRLTGTFLTPEGDYRYLEGDYRGGLLRLSAFDGGHAFLFQARVTADGSLVGDFWSRDIYHATWVGHRLAGEAGEEDELPDPFEVVGLTNDEGRFSF